MKKLIIVSFIYLFSISCEKGWLRELISPTIEGCNISSACNYNPDVNKFDNSCEYLSCIDCKGMLYGAATIDSCGTCDAVALNDCLKDCAGVWGGGKMFDCQGVCDGTNSLDHCNECDADSSNDCVADCAGVWGGSSVRDACDICNGSGICECGNGTISCDCCCPGGQERDCSGECGGSAVIDQCEVCDGTNSCLPPDLFSFNQSSHQAYYFVLSAYDYNGEYLDENKDWIGVFNGNVCVGARLWPGGPIDVPTMGDDGNAYSSGYLNAGDMPTFKIYDVSEDEYYDAITNENFGYQPNAIYNILRMDVYVDCLGVIGGTAVTDMCGVCNGSNICVGSECTDNSTPYCQDLDVLNDFIELNESLSGRHPLEIGIQVWIDARLISFGLVGAQITTIPNSIGNLNNLEHLGLFFNQISDLPESLGNLTNLIDLRLSGNEISTLPESFVNLINLRRLELGFLSYGNNLTNFPEGFENLIELEYLFLESNQLSTIPESIWALNNLTVLTLTNNEISNLPDGIGNLVNLTELYLSNNQLTTLPESIGNLINVNLIRLDNNNLTSLPETICSITNIYVYNNFLCEEYHYECIRGWQAADEYIQNQLNCCEGENGIPNWTQCP